MKQGISLSGTLFAIAGALMISACGEGASEDAAVADPIEVTGARIVLAAVPGNPAAGYFTLRNGGKDAVVLRRAAIAGAADVQLHETMEYNREMVMGEMMPLIINPGTTVTFEPGGKHLMVMGAPADWKAGGTAKVTLTFLGGATTSFDAPLQAAGADR